MAKLTDPVQFLYLTTIGRKTGLWREIEIWFVELEGKYHVLAEHREKGRWVMNIQANPRVRVGDQSFDATAGHTKKHNDSNARNMAGARARKLRWLPWEERDAWLCVEEEGCALLIRKLR